MMLWVVVVAACVGLGSAQLDIGPLGDVMHAGAKININKTVDRILPRIAEALGQRGYENIVLPDITVDSTPVLIGVTLEGMTSVTRSGNAEAIILDFETLDATGVLRLREPRLSVYLCPYMNSNFTWDMQYIDFEVEVDFLPTPKHYDVDCYTRFKYFKILRVGGIVQHSSNPEFDGVAPDQKLLDLVVSQYNEWFLNSQILSMVNSAFNFCEPGQ